MRHFLYFILMVVSGYLVAQNVSSAPEIIGFQSTSAMSGSGSTLPMAVISGVRTTYDFPQPSRSLISGRRFIGDDEGFEDEEDPNKPGEPMPIGDGIVVLALCMAIYVCSRYCYRLNKKHITNERCDK